MRIALYNPLSLIRPGRILHIALSLNCDAVLLPGTCIRGNQHDSHKVANVNSEFWAIHCGYGSGPFTNHTAGCSVIFRKKVFPKSCIQQLQFAPKELKGRGVCIRCKRQRMDINFILGYSPPHGSGANPAARKGADLTNKWLRAQYEATPLRSLPILGMDANTQFGIDNTGIKWEAELGDFNLGKPTTLGQTWEPWLQKVSATSAGTYHSKVQPSYYPIDDEQKPTYVDHLIVPKIFAENPNTKVATAWSAARRLQLIPDTRPRDHVPQVLSFYYHFPFSKKSTQERRKWDLNALGQCLQKSKNKIPFLHDLEQEFAAIKPQITSAFNDRHCENSWELWITTLQKVGQKHFSEKNKTTLTKTS